MQCDLLCGAGCQNIQPPKLSLYSVTHSPPKKCRTVTTFHSLTRVEKVTCGPAGYNSSSLCVCI